MSKVMFLGDVHGNAAHMMRIFEIAEDEDVDEIIQVGDFGYWEHEKGGVAFLDLIAAEAPCPVRFIDGNHDNHPLLWDRYPNIGGTSTVRGAKVGKLPTLLYQHRGSVLSYGDLTMQFMGGAFSIDYQWRQQANRRGKQCWWPEEIITDTQVEDAKIAAAWWDQIDVLVTHDVPSGAPLGRLTNLTLSKSVEEQARYNRRKLLEVVQAVKPKLLIHGHYHTRLDYWMDYKDDDDVWHKLDCISLSCDVESHHARNPVEDSYIIVDIEELRR